ncbi:MAG: membrane or secreted protein [Flavobacteriaceae bacterium]|nr:membrane or secreted protein [Flavobacteriaceae bacterium]
MKLFLITTVLLGICFAGIAVKIWGKKNGEFAGTCASQNPFLNKNNEPCGMCGKLPKDQDCKTPNPQAN